MNVTTLLIASMIIAAGSGFSQAASACDVNGMITRFAFEIRNGEPRCCMCIGSEAECARAAKAMPVTYPGCIADIAFAYNADLLTPRARRVARVWARALASEPLKTAAFIVGGHTDMVGSEPFNLRLSERRAAAVVRYLVRIGVDATRLRTKGYGKTMPNTAPDGVDRRAEIRLDRSGDHK